MAHFYSFVGGPNIGAPNTSHVRDVYKHGVSTSIHLLELISQYICTLTLCVLKFNPSLQQGYEHPRQETNQKVLGLKKNKKSII